MTSRRVDAVYELAFTRVALDKLGARSISREATEEVLSNHHVIVRNLRGRAERRQTADRRYLVGQTHGGRTLTLVIAPTLDPVSWLVITGWDATAVERRLVRRRR